MNPNISEVKRMNPNIRSKKDESKYISEVKRMNPNIYQK